jgi:hypothetical protein
MNARSAQTCFLAYGCAMALIIARAPCSSRWKGYSSFFSRRNLTKALASVLVLKGGFYDVNFKT